MPLHAVAQTPPIAEARQTPVLVTANPLGSSEISSPSASLYGQQLIFREADSLGETLNGIPGISTTTYGPMVGRPIIRGMDGDRIRILQNGVASLDASSLSYDHAVPGDSLSAERIEIVKGPAALLYGGNAVGGVINVIDNRIPTEPIKGVTGSVDARYGGANTQRAGAATVEGGNGQFAFHVDAYGRKTGELRVPGFARSARQRAIDAANVDEDGNGVAQPYNRVPNSDGRDSGGAAGASYTWADGYAGLSFSGFQSDYGSVAEDDVRIKMWQQRVAFASEVRNLQGPFKSVKANFAYSDYQHKEVSNGETGTTFKNHGYEGRIEARHADIGPLSGAIGIQFSQTQFSALGDEALVPRTDTDNVALFGLEEWTVNDALKLSLGGRVEHTRLKPYGDGNERFTDASSRNFTAGSLSGGAIYKLTPVWSLVGNLAYTERTPTFYELYANGPHDATGQYLIGNPNAQKEKALSADFSVKFDTGLHRASAGVFYTRFRNYLTEFNTGRQVDDDGNVTTGGDSLSEAVYRGVPAQFFGVELQGRSRLYTSGPHRIDADLSGDYTNARDLDNGEPLPRIPPLRLTAGLEYGYLNWQARGEIVHAWGQHRYPDNDTSTGSYTTLGLTLSYAFRAGNTQWLAFVRGSNLTNQEVRYATSVLRDIAPQGGRAVMVGLHTTF